MKVLFVASECTPIAKVGGLGDVIGSLPKALKELGVDVRICLPKYQIIDLKKHKFEQVSKDIIVKDEKVNPVRCLLSNRVNVYQGFLPESRVIIYLLENEKYLGENGVYFEKSAFCGSFQEIERFLFFSRAILEVFSAIDWFPDIIHCHDWHTAILPVLAKLNPKSEISNLKSVLTVHNLANQGKGGAKEIFDFLNLKEDKTKTLLIKDEYGNVNIFQQGILNADLINAVSPTYAKEILTKEYGEGLENWLLKRKKELFGILNGIDEKKFNPQTDPDLKSNYSWQNLERKAENKIHLQEILNFKKNPEIPFFAFIGRLTSQKGIDLIIEVIPELIKNNYQLIILGAGNPDYEKKLLELSQKYPQNISSQIKFDPVLAQKIYAGADIFLMPSKFEPCGLVQMMAMRYGAIPIGRKTGGLADTIEDEKTGFLFKEYNAKSFLEAINKALKLYQDKKEWQKLMKESMKKDFSWQKSAKKYLEVYQKLL